MFVTNWISTTKTQKISEITNFFRHYFLSRTEVMFRIMIDKRIESTMNELINAEIWSTNLYLSLQVYFESEQLPILSSWLNTQAQDNMNKVYQMMSWIYHNGGCVAINEIKRDVQNGKLQ